MSDAQDWGERAEDVLAKGYAAGVGTICPVHWRPIKRRWGVGQDRVIEPCHCPLDDEEQDQIGLHGLDEVRWMFEDVDAVGRVAD